MTADGLDQLQRFFLPAEHRVALGYVAVQERGWLAALHLDEIVQCRLGLAFQQKHPALEL